MSVFWSNPETLLRGSVERRLEMCVCVWTWDLMRVLLLDMVRDVL